MRRWQNHILIAIAAATTIPGIALRLSGAELAPWWMTFWSGVAILGASFLLLWACDAAQKDMSQSLALAVVALVAVLPEYAVSMYFTWEAGRHPSSNYAEYSIANMTGANRLLVGVAWALVTLIFWARYRRQVHIEAERRTELFFLGLATAYAFVIPIKGTLAWYDGVVFLAIYVWYIFIAGRRPATDVEELGPSALLMALPKAKRITVTSALFLVSAAAIVANAKPFSEGLVATGRLAHINEFLLVQWLAPIASEAPEFIVGIIFAWRGHGGLALGSLLSSKLNQWTLLVGMIPGVYAVAHGSLDRPIPMGQFQMNEILLTAAQSLLAVVMLASMRMTLPRAGLLFVLFIGQFLSPLLVPLCPGGKLCGYEGQQVHWFFSALYLGAAAAFFVAKPKETFALKEGIKVTSGHN